MTTKKNGGGARGGRACVAMAKMAKSFDVYLIPVNRRFVLYATPEAIAAAEAEAPDHLREFIDWMNGRRNRLLSWIGRGVRSLHDYYIKLEEKIDPAERVLKAMASMDRYVVFTVEPEAFRRSLGRQRWKHIFWFSIDLAITAVVIVFTPILAPIPGPNLFFYYPFLRLLSHRRAIQGAASALRGVDIEFRDLRQVHEWERQVPGLARLLEKMN